MGDKVFLKLFFNVYILKSKLDLTICELFGFIALLIISIL